MVSLGHTLQYQKLIKKKPKTMKGSCQRILWTSMAKDKKFEYTKYNTNTTD